MKFCFLPILISLFILISCSETGNDEIPGEISLGVSTYGENFKIFFGDCRGDEEEEIIFASNAMILIFSKSGKQLLEKKLNGSKFVPVFLADTDSDGKMDILMGTSASSKNKIVSINGMGNVISSFVEEKTYHDFSSIIPQLIKGDRIFALARPADDESPRGILCFDKYSMKLLWTFYTPDPMELIELDNHRFSLSYFSHGNGTFVHYGHEDSFYERRDYEVKGMYLVIGDQGEAIYEREIISNHPDPVGKIELLNIPGDSESLLLNHNHDEFALKYQIIKIHKDNGRILEKSNWIEGDFKEQKILKVGNEWSLYVSHDRGGKHYLLELDSSLEIVRQVEMDKSLMLGPAVSHYTDGFMRHSAFTDTKVFIINSNFEMNPIFEAEGIKNIYFFQHKDMNKGVILKEESFHIINID